MLYDIMALQDSRNTIADTLRNARNLMRAKSPHLTPRLRNAIARGRASHCLARAGIMYDYHYEA